MTIDERLARAIGAKGWTQQDTADALGVGRASVNALLNGGRNLTADMAVRLETVFDVPAQRWLADQSERDLHHARDALAEWVQWYRKQKGKGRRR